MLGGNVFGWTLDGKSAFPVFDAYLDPKTGAQVERNGISLSGSLHAINRALYFRAPAAPSS